MGRPFLLIIPVLAARPFIGQGGARNNWIDDKVRPKSAPTRDSAALLLNALVWILSDGDRAHRLLVLTGLEVEDLRARANAPETLLAVGRFLADHERDLVACAAALDSAPSALIVAMQTLSGEEE